MATLPNCILPDSADVQLDKIVVGEGNQCITLTMSAIASSAACPVCSDQARRVHRHYTRTLADLAWANVPVRILLHVRRFFCDTTGCSCRIFTERLPTIARPYARRTSRLAAVQHRIGLIAGGSGGAALCGTLACPTSTDAVLDLLRQRNPIQQPTPRVLGVDDWAMRKGQCYGTILVDHERGHVVDLLPDRTPETLATWLQDHPGIEIVTRDRAEAYAQGITQGAPDAIQVADRWHLLKNLTDALTILFQDHRRAIDQHLGEQHNQKEAPEESNSQPAITAHQIQAKTPTVADEQRQTRAEQAHHFHEQGWTNKRIARHLDCHPKTISRYLQRQLPLAVGRQGRSRKLDDYTSYLLKRWDEGCQNAAQLHRELQAQGFDGGCTILHEFVADLRTKSGHSKGTTPTGASKRTRSSRMLAWMSTQAPKHLDDDQQKLLEQIQAASPLLRTAILLAQQWSEMVCKRKAEDLDSWLESALQSGATRLRSFANGLKDDIDAVRAALTLEWSNGRTEGSVSRLKCVKRQMYGRAKLDLLRLRLIAP